MARNRSGLRSTGRRIVKSVGRKSTTRRRNNFVRRVELGVERLEPRWVLAAGALDTTFDPVDLDGVLIGNLGAPATADVRFTAVTTQADGKILAAGTLDALANNQQDFIVARFNANGTLDTTFGVDGPDADALPDGYINFDFSFPTGQNFAEDITLDASGRIIVVGSGPNAINFNSWTIARLTSSGQLDTTFNGTGKVVTSWTGLTGNVGAVAHGVAVQADGKIVVAGDVRNLSFITDFDWGIARYNNDGTLDTTFGTGGKVVQDFFGLRDVPNDVKIQSDGKIVAAGYVRITGQSDNFAVARFNTNGTFDSTFGSGGFTTTNVDPTAFVSQDQASSLQIQTDGRIVLTGFSNVRPSSVSTFTTTEFTVARYLANGTLDTTFDPVPPGGFPSVPGTRRIDFGGQTDIAEAVGVQVNGYYVVAGSLSNPTAHDDNDKFGLARLVNNSLLVSDGTLDSTFGSGGLVSTRISDYVPGTIGYALLTDMTLQPDGKIVAVGYEQGPDGREKFVIARYESGLATQTISGPADINEGQTYTLTLSSSDPTTSQWTINWGDSTQVVPGNPTSVTHVYADGNANYTITAAVTTATGTTPVTNAVAVAVHNVAPTLAISGASDVNEGSAYTLSLSSSDPGTDTITQWTINWGDGTQVVAGNPSSVSHTYADGNASYTITATATDEDGTFAAGNSVGVTVHNVAPTLAISGASDVNEGSSYTLNLSATDPGADTISQWTINWGDGTQVVSGNPSGVSHTYADGDNNYTISATATDEDGTYSAGNAVAVAVHNVSPTLVISGTSDVNEGALYTLNLSSLDPGADAITQWTINWGDGTEVVSGNPSSVTHTYGDGDASYSISATATDEDGTFAAGNAVGVTVHNIAPTLAISGASDVNEGSSYTLNLSSFDLGDDTITQWTINWGDGTQIVSGNPSSVSHTYADGDANYTISASATDEDGTFAAGNTVAVAVHNVAPTVDDATFSVPENSANGTVVGTVTANDPGTDTLSFSIVGGTGAAAFGINSASGQITVTNGMLLDFDTNPVLTLNVEVSDGEGGVGTALITINVIELPSISGVVYVDINHNGLFDANEPGIDGVIIHLLDQYGNPVLDGNGDAITTVTDNDGLYVFNGLQPGTYQVFEQQPTGVTDGLEQLGSLGGTIVANDRMQLTLTTTDAYDYAFAEFGQQLRSGDAAGIGFWQNKNGQALIAQGGTQLAAWLTSNFGNIFGNMLVGMTGSQVATFYRDQVFKGLKLGGPAKVDAQFMAVALATFFTDSTLAGLVATAYGFNVSDTGIGTKIVNVGTRGAAFNVANGSDLTIMQLLLATNNLTDQPNSILGFAAVYDQDGDGVISSAEASLRTMANEVFSSINESGGI